jgi:transcriptional regulator GlxA family with amidase domain
MRDQMSLGDQAFFYHSSCPAPGIVAIVEVAKKAYPDETQFDPAAPYGNVFSGGGVTAGIDMALTVMAEIAGRDHAEAVQLGMEYAPAPPFQSGRPELARPEILERVRRSMDRVRTRRVAAAERAGARLES